MQTLSFKRLEEDILFELFSEKERNQLYTREDDAPLPDYEEFGDVEGPITVPRPGKVKVYYEAEPTNVVVRDMTKAEYSAWRKVMQEDNLTYGGK